VSVYLITKMYLSRN